MSKPFSEFVKLTDETVFNKDRISDYFNALQKSELNGKIDVEKLVAALAVNVRSDILSALKAYHDWNV